MTETFVIEEVFIIKIINKNVIIFLIQDINWIKKRCPSVIWYIQQS